MTLTKQEQEAIWDEAWKLYPENKNDRGYDTNNKSRAAWAKGATAYALKAKVLVEGIKEAMGLLDENAKGVEGRTFRSLNDTLSSYNQPSGE